jgi:HK97 family phage portal protein
MGIFDRFRKEERGEVPAGSVPVSSSNFLEVITGMRGSMSSSGLSVSTESALGVPAVWAAVNFLSGTLAGLPLHQYRRQRDGSRDRVSGGLANILHDAVNDETSSFEWRKAMFDQVFTTGRAFTFIERNSQGRIMNLWPLDPAGVTVKINGWTKEYSYVIGRENHKYAASEIIDIAFMMKNDRVSHRGPITQCKDAIGLSIAATEYGSKFFLNGGVPPFAVTGNFMSGKAMERAADDLAAAVRKASKDQRQALVMPAGLEIKSIGTDAEKSQLVELKRFCIEEIARVYSLPPTFLQDLSHGTFSNTEQQDLHFVKHTLKRWVEQVEQELNLKLFGRSNNRQFVEFSMDGLLRGDFKTRMEGYAKAIQNTLLTPNEARRRENLPDIEGGDDALVQGATVPLTQQLRLPLQMPEE